MDRHELTQASSNKCTLCKCDRQRRRVSQRRATSEDVSAEWRSKGWKGDNPTQGYTGPQWKERNSSCTGPEVHKGWHVPGSEQWVRGRGEQGSHPRESGLDGSLDFILSTTYSPLTPTSNGSPIRKYIKENKPLKKGKYFNKYFLEYLMPKQLAKCYTPATLGCKLKPGTN